MRLYAQATDVADYEPGGAKVPTGQVDRLIRVASRVMDRLLVGVVYDTTPAGMPSDPDVAAVFTDVCCSIVVAAYDAGVLAGPDELVWDSVSIGNVSLSGRADQAMVSGVPVPAAALIQLEDVGPRVVVTL